VGELSHHKYRFVQTGDALVTADLVSLLDELLAAERAGVRVAAALREDHPPGRLRTVLDIVGIDEAESCRLLAEAIRMLGAEPADGTGDFAQRALAIEGANERLAFLQRGQRWVVRRLDETIPRVEQSEVAAALQSMREIHQANIATLDELLASRPEATPPAATRRS
jgi:nitronate monooxygenase